MAEGTAAFEGCHRNIRIEDNRDRATELITNMTNTPPATSIATLRIAIIDPI